VTSNLWKRFRSLPVEINAIRFTVETREEVLAELLKLNGGVSHFFESDYPCLIIPTLEGDILASVGDWIIIGLKGELYPCKPAIFELKYKEVVEHDRNNRCE